MTQEGSAFPVPVRSNRSSQPDVAREHFPELDLLQRIREARDGRPVLIEDWFDLDTRYFCRTAFYSPLGIEGWSPEQHYTYLDESGLLIGKTDASRGVGLKRIMDDADQEVWSVTVVIKRDDDGL